MHSRAVVVGSIAAGIAIGYIAAFLTYYNALSNVQAANTGDLKEDLEALKSDLEKAGTKISVLSEDNEKLHSTIAQVRANNEELQKRVSSLQGSINDPEGSMARVEQGLLLLHLASEPMPYAGKELAEWRVTIVNETARLDPDLVPTMLKLVDSWADVVQFEETEPELNTEEWDRWNEQWQVKALTYIESYNIAVSEITNIMIHDIDSIKSSLTG